MCIYFNLLIYKLIFLELQSVIITSDNEVQTATTMNSKLIYNYKNFG